MPIDGKSMLRVRDRLVPVIVMCDGTHHLNFAGDRAGWPVYMTIANRSLKMHHMPSTHIVIMVAPLMIPITISNNPLKRLDD